MSFKAALAILAASALPLQGCARLGFGEKIPPADTLKVGRGETACLNDAGKVIEDYLAARSGPESIEAMYGCVDRSIQLFLDKTRTNTPGVYHPTELRHFLEKFFIGEDRISNALMAETMEFKRSVLGGRGDILTADELRAARRIMAVFKEQLLRLDRYRPLDLSRLAALPAVEQNEVLAQIGVAATDFGTVLSSSAGDYSMGRFESLLREFERAFPGEGLRRILARFKLIRSFKSVLFGTSADEFRGSEWPIFLRTTARLLGIYVKVQPIYPDESGHFPVLSCGPGLQRLREAGLEFFALLDQAIQNHGSLQMVPLLELSRVIDALDPADLPEIRRLSMKRFLRPVVRRYFAGDVEGALGRDADGITSVSVENARRAFLDWWDGQKFIEGAFSRLGTFDCQGDPASRPAYSLRELESVSIEAALGVNRVEDLDPRTVVAVEDLRKVIAGRIPIHAAQGPLWVIDPSQPREKFTYNDLFQSNWLSIGFRLAQKGYRESRYDSLREAGGDPQAFASPEIEALYDDIREIGTDLKFVDPTAWEAPKQRFRDGNLFMPSGNGDMKLLNLGEGTEIVGALISAKSASADLQDAILKLCKSVPGGMFGTRLIEQGCYREQLVSQFDEYFSNLPALARYLRSLKAAESANFFDLLFRASKPPTAKPEYMDVNDSDRLSTLLHYVELVYLKFDRNSNGRLDTGESLRAFERFEGILKTIAKDRVKDREGLQALFTYMLTRGKIPETALEKAGFLWWKARGPNSWKMSVERSTILLVFSKLAESTSSKKGGGGGDAGGEALRLRQEESGELLSPAWQGGY